MSDGVPLPPAGLNYIAAIRPSLNLILILTPLGSVLVPLLLTLFFFSTPQSRRHPVFILNILACCSGICEAATNVALETKQILFPLQPTSRELLTSVIAFSIVLPLFIDSILLCRILAFYPLSLTSNRKLAAIFTIPIVVKCGRFIAAVMYLHQFTYASRNLPNLLLSLLLSSRLAWPKNPYILTEWSLQTIDNMYSTFFFLYKIYQFRQKDEKFIIRSKSLLAHLHSLFIIAVGNFVFPVVINIASIILIVTNPSAVTGTYVLLSNNYLAIIGVVFATIWTRRQNWNRHDHGPGPNSKRDEEANRFTFDPGVRDTRTALSSLHFRAANEGGVNVDTQNRIEVQTLLTERQGNDSDLSRSNGSFFD